MTAIIAPPGLGWRRVGFAGRGASRAIVRSLIEPAISLGSSCAQLPARGSTADMGADLIGWKPCSLQRELGPDGFLGKLKLRAYRSAVERQVPEAARAKVKISVEVTGRPPRELAYPDIVAESEQFLAGIPECASCPLAGGGTPLGCYHYVTYPIDAPAEELLFAFFTQPSQIATKDSISDQLYRDLISRIPSSGTGWHRQRGPRGPLAIRAEPLGHKWGGLFSKRTVDSAQLLQCLFIALDSLPLVAAYGRFWSEFVAFAKERGVAAGTSRTLDELFGLARMMMVVAPIGGRLIADS